MNEFILCIIADTILPFLLRIVRICRVCFGMWYDAECNYCIL